MRLPRLFFGLAAIAAGFAIAGALAGQVLIPGTPLERFAPPESVFNYQPNPLSAIPVIGDFIWAVAQVLMWMKAVPELLSATIAALGVPEPLPSILTGLSLMGLAAFIIYIVSGRPVTTG